MQILFGIGPKPVLSAIVLLFVVLLSACSDKTEREIMLFRALDKNLENSTITINRSTEQIMMSLNEKLKDPVTRMKAQTWYPKAELIQHLSKDMCTYIEGLKKEIKQEAGLKTTGATEAFNETDRDAVKRVCIVNGKARELYTNLKRYQDDILAVDPYIGLAFNGVMALTQTVFDTSMNKSQEFADLFFGYTYPVAALTFLSQIQNNVKSMENRMIQLCHNKCISCAGICTFELPLVGQSSTYVRAGEKIEITAGIGSFPWRTTKPDIIINGKRVLLSESGVAIHKVNASTKPGKHYIPVVITFTDQDGKIQSIEKNVEYTVAEEMRQNN